MAAAGGWRLACDLDRVTLYDVYAALGAPELLAIGHRNNAPGCLVEKAVNAALGTAFQDAERLLTMRMGEVTLGRLYADFSARLAGRELCGEDIHPDAA
jgi:DNA-binding IscR family transcriptional regulator